MLLIGLMGCAQAWSIPAKRIPFTVTNSDGTVLTLVLCGDESYHFFTTTDGVPAVKGEDGDWQLKPEWTDSLHQTWLERNQRRNARRIERAERRRAQRVPFGQSSYVTGQKKGIVILINFPDLSMKSNHTKAVFEDMFNKVGYTEDNHYGSVHDYFYDQSYGQLDLTFDIFGPVTATESYKYYGANDVNGNDMRVATLTAEICKTADKECDINWSDYDWDGDGEVDQVYIIYAGVGEAESWEEDRIWPHEWTLDEGLEEGDGDGSFTLDGVTINTYAMSDELPNSQTSKKLNGIGTACHEFSHCLGLPDLYDISYNGGYGMGSWDIMSGGNYNGYNYHGECPPGYTAYERWFTGWLDLTELKEATTITGMPDLQDEPVAYIIRNDGNNDEYFILENRQAKGWYAYTEDVTGSHGMLVCHVDYNKNAWKNNNVNAKAKHQRMTIIPAAGVYGTLMGEPNNMYYVVTADQYHSQLFPGSDSITVLDNDSHKDCGGTLFSKNTDGTYLMNKPITDITEQDGLISFKFMGGGDPVAIRDITANPSTATDGKQAPTAYYTLQGIKVDAPQSGIYIIKEGNSSRKIVIP